jgi:hypothetical protein
MSIKEPGEEKGDQRRESMVEKTEYTKVQRCERIWNIGGGP